ncbi:uncharacterized protein [Euwallacea fornicatus]|uniref:uncharacterized protein n=1 Tax=Euwallacea fornicatus TaxID=995702 RepID=UPI00338D7BF7
MKFHRWFYCCKICSCKDEEKTDNILQETPPPTVLQSPPILTQPLPRSSTNTEISTRPKISTIYEGTRTSSESFKSCFSYGKTSNSGEDIQNQNVTTRNSKAQIPSISAAVDSHRTLKTTVSSPKFETWDPSIPKLSATESTLNHSPPHRGSPTIAIQPPNILKPQLQDIPIILTPKVSLESQHKSSSKSLTEKNEQRKEETFIHSKFSFLDMSKKIFETSNPFPKLRVADSPTYLPLSVPLKPEPTSASTTLKPTLPYLYTSTTSVNTSDPFPKLRSLDVAVHSVPVVPIAPEALYSTTLKSELSLVDTSITIVKPSVSLPKCPFGHPSTSLKTVTPLDSRTESPPPLLLSASSLLLQTSHPFIRSSPNEDLLTDLLRSLQKHHLPTLPKANAYQLESLNLKSENFVENVLFRNRKFRSYYEIKAMKRIWNPYLMLHYQLNERKYGDKFTNRFMYHGTSLVAANEIFKYNFNWRMVKEYNFGKGTYFANNPYYASHYGKRNADPRLKDYVMIVAKVLIEKGEIQRGFPHVLPPPGHSTNSDSKQEFIKFDDCVFYPEFLVLYRPL